jgi:two-component system, OmpR family, response regulator
VASILVADDDPWILKMVADLLAARGHDVRTATDGQDALALAEERTPELIVTDVWMPRMDGFTLIRTLRTRPKLAFVPVLFLTSDATAPSRMKGFQLGADEYITKPFRFDDLSGHIDQILAKARPKPRLTPPPASESSALQGDLTQLGLAGVLTLLEMERKSGVLRLEGEAGSAEMHVRDGRIVYASFDGGAENAQAVYAALAWDGGHFAFERGDVTRTDEIQTPTTYLLMEGMRLLDESRRTDVEK